MLALAACTGKPAPPQGTVDHVQAYFGGLAADEPRAALVARDILSAGGSAVDAAVGAYFALSVTMPATAGLGGGGVCVVHAAGGLVVEAIDFTARAPAGPVPPGRWAVAVPGNVRGMFALHARYGRLRWERVVRPAEHLARFGIKISRALAGEAAVAGERLGADRETLRVFGGADGKGVREGRNLRQLDLATVLGRIRANGAGDFYLGEVARKLARGVGAAGGYLPVRELRSYRPVWRATATEKFGDHTVHLPPLPVSGGMFAAAMWRRLVAGGGYRSGSGAGRLRSIAAAVAEAYRGRLDYLQRDYGIAAWIVMDREGGAVACGVTMNQVFGSGRVIPGTGIVAVYPPRPGRDGAVALAPVLVVNRHNGESFAAASASGRAAPVALISVLVRALEEGRPLDETLDAVRAIPGPAPSSLLVERHATRAVRARLAALGLEVGEAPNLGRVSIMYCPDGMAGNPRQCDVGTDRRGFGYAINAEF